LASTELEIAALSRELAVIATQVVHPKQVLEKLWVADRQQLKPRPRMNIHKNARTIPMARRVAAGERDPCLIPETPS
jgi:hypothetical protein